MRLVVSALVLTAAALAVPAAEQNPPAGQAAAAALRVEVTPATLTLKLGESTTLKAVVRDAAGNVVPDARVVFSANRRQLAVSADGVVQAVQPGTHTVTVTALPPGADGAGAGGRGGRGGAAAPNRVEIVVTVPEPAIATVTFNDPPSRLYAGTRVALAVNVVDEAGRERKGEAIAWTSSNAAVASVDAFGDLQLHSPGTTRLGAATGGVTATLDVTVADNPVAAFEVTAPVASARTGDVIHFSALARDRAGQPVTDVPVRYAVTGETAPGILGAGATAQIEPDGRFVAERSGRYTVVATTGSHTAMATVEIASREVSRGVEVVGRGKVQDRHTSDLWVWEGVDGRDYAVTGTWGADGHAYFWDVTDPASIEKIGEVQVDARTVNDVKVSPDGRFAVISREGASNRRNGIVIIDVTNPRAGLPILSTFDDELTGGVHNVFVDDGHVFALSAGQRYDIINVEDPRAPRRVGSYTHDAPGPRIHDVWVVDGIAYSSNWTYGVVAVDVGGGGQGGSPQNPVKLGAYAYPSGWNHAAFPYVSQSTGKRYIFAGDESFPEGTPTNRAGRADGWIHVIDWTDWDHPKEVARYAVDDAGTHNLWVEDDVMYVAYYNGGLRVVDVSGELLGDLGRQGREIARFYPYDPEGFIPNAPFVWGPQPYKGLIYFSDFNSGLWAVRLTGPVPSRRGEPR